MTDNETIDDTSSQLSLLKRLVHSFLRVVLWLIVMAASGQERQEINAVQ